MRFSTKCWSEHILSAYKATKDLKHPLYMTFKIFHSNNQVSHFRHMLITGDSHYVNFAYLDTVTNVEVILNISSLYIFAFQLHLCQKWLT